MFGDALLLLLVAASFAYSALVIVAVWRYQRGSKPELRSTEPVSILKPLSGLDLGLESNLRTFFEQDYPNFEILFAVRDPEDPAAEVVARLQREYPSVASRLLVTG